MRGINSDIRKDNRSIYLEINRSAVDLPVPEAGRICTAAATYLRRHFYRLPVSATLFGLGKRALGSRREQLAGSLGGFSRQGFVVVIIRCLHHAIPPEKH